MKRSQRLGLALATVLATATTVTAAPMATAGQDRLDPEAIAVGRLTRGNAWTQTASLKLDFDTFHMQGMSVVGDHIWLSSVEILQPTVKHPAPVDGMDRTPGKGRGHVFVVTRDGKLVKDIVLGEGDFYHPGGIDFDGRKVWVPVAEYRPHSKSIVYSIDPDTYRVREEFRADDHVGGVVNDRKHRRIAAVTWGSREFLTFKKGRLVDEMSNPTAMVDYQDCEYSGAGTMICTGITGLKDADGKPFELGGVALLDIRSGSLVNEVPVQVFSNNKHVVTRNPVTFEAKGSTLTMFAAPDDGEEGSELLVHTTQI
ncbi:DUF6454 family protein [Luteococcus japonicus]|uniref:Uncharacterized protein n=1 Tax=Luteococcus japonicus LSP_Lj1 TaxID=1255658 RepID=A0A1R4K7I6_9ACTN|nr:DUF6454 family protein [Luteococcus japonicus]SJN40085.1 hypothetical protein FM114_11930 [Luteococcus japonicus LSP_Lj1]